ncbi:MAG: bifunctional demethylmenaquinone methyltransferase/2-methoxy-6-polyprenyl-1,4-benzoquinol methylase UbiE [Planctomycetaceae bacterium]|nr:bifunctional demethylmenaquinone methyltransferase/2-methoxy-6-polyprenyl-1,4-benzoquinol methylase UbiE [Planctomycetaceae bacterium]
MFGEIAGRYDLLNHVLSLGVDVYWRWRTVRTVAPSGDRPILDVCTGTGDLAFAYRQHAGEGVRVIGSDFTRAMLMIADRKQPSEDEQQQVAFVEADAQQLPFASDQFQIVSVAFGLRNVADTRRGIREMARVCSPQGTVAVLEFSQPTNRLFAGVYRFYFRNVLPRIGQWISGSRLDAYNYLPESVGEFPCGAALAQVMTECGLCEVQYKPLTFGIATLYWGRKSGANSADSR